MAFIMLYYILWVFFLHLYLLYPTVRKQETIVSYWLLTVDRLPSCIAIEAPINGKDQTPIKQAPVTNPRPLLVNHSPIYFSKCWLNPWLDTNILHHFTVCLIDMFCFMTCGKNNTTWWLIPLSKWVITPVISGLTLLIPFITGVITHLRAVGWATK